MRQQVACEYNGQSIAVDGADPRFQLSKSGTGVASPALILDKDNVVVVNIDERGIKRGCDFYPIIDKDNIVQDLSLSDEDKCRFDENDPYFLKEKERLDREVFEPSQASEQVRFVPVAKITGRDEISTIFIKANKVVGCNQRQVVSGTIGNEPTIYSAEVLAQFLAESRQLAPEMPELPEPVSKIEPGLAGYLKTDRETCETRDVCSCDPVATRSIVIPKSLLPFRFPDCLAYFKNVTALDAHGTKVTNAGAIAGLTNVEQIMLANTGLNAISDVSWIDQLARLKYADLSGNKIPAIGPEFTGRRNDFTISAVHGGEQAVSDLQQSVRSWKGTAPAPLQFGPPGIIGTGAAATVPAGGKLVCIKSDGAVSELPEILLPAAGNACFVTKLASPGYVCDIIGGESRRIEDEFNAVMIDAVGEKRCSDASITGADPSAPPSRDSQILNVEGIAGDISCDKWRWGGDYEPSLSMLRCVLQPAQAAATATASTRRGKRRY